MRLADGFLLVYSVTSRESFEEIVTAYQQILRFKEKGSFSVILLGNKCDLEHKREVGVDGMSLLNPIYKILMPRWHPCIVLTAVTTQRVGTLPETWDAHSLRHPQRRISTWMRPFSTSPVKSANGCGNSWSQPWSDCEIDVIFFAFSGTRHSGNCPTWWSGRLLMRPPWWLCHHLAWAEIEYVSGKFTFLYMTLCL